MNSTLNEQDTQYLLQVLSARPLGEALPLFLKMTGQQLVPAMPPPMPAPPPDVGGTSGTP